MGVLIKIIKEMILLIAVAVIFAFTVNHFSKNGIALVGQWDKSKGTVRALKHGEIVIPGFEIQDITTVKKIYDSKQILFVDARPYDVYEEGRIAGAVCLPVNEFDDRFGEFMSKYGPDTKIITYCSGRECSDSHDLAQMLIENGYHDVHVFPDGYPAWEQKGYPIEKGQTE